MPWLARKAASMATVKARLTQNTDPDGVASITAEGMATGGKAMTYRLDGCEMTHEGRQGVTRMRALLVDGPVSKPVLSLAGPEALGPYLTAGWLCEDGEPTELPQHIQIYIDHSTAGSVEQIWGFSMIGGQRRHVQKTVAKKDSKCVKTRVVYDWLKR